MKIICVGQNYHAHVKEMNSKPVSEPLFFIKPDTSLLLKNKPFYYPGFTKDLHYEAEIVVRIDRAGKYIQKRYAGNYYNEVAFGLDLTARDIQKECKKEGKPWEICKAFEHSAPLSHFLDLVQEGMDINNIDFHLNINGKTVQKGNTADMIYTVDEIISFVSTFFPLKIGDLIFTGTPAGVGPLSIGDRIEGYIGKHLMLSMKVK